MFIFNLLYLNKLLYYIIKINLINILNITKSKR